MYCLENIERIAYPADLVMDLTKLYCFKGKDFFYEDIFRNDMTTIKKDTVEKETIYAAKVLKLNVSENRARLIVRKNGTPKTNDEKILLHLKDVFRIIQEKGNEVELTSNEFLALAERIYRDVKDIGYRTENIDVQVNLLKEKKKIFLRDKFDELLKMYKKYLNSERVEITQLTTNLFVDIVNLNIYTEQNNFLCLLIYYCLLFRERFNVFKYVSFFEMYLEHEEEFKTNLVQASYNWEQGFAQTANLNRLTIKMLLKGYNQIEAKSDLYNFDKKIRKIDNVESSILKMGEIFTKDEIRNINPYLSDSTINRALENLKKQNKIRPNGTGRSATWIKIYDAEPIDIRNQQISIFDLKLDDEDF